MRTNLPLKAKLSILVAIPLLFATALGLKLSLERIQDAREFASFQDAMRLANHLAAVNEAASAEQGSVWSYTPTAIAENGETVVNQVRAQHAQAGQELDAAFAKMAAYRDGLHLEAYDPELRRVLAEIDSAIAKLQQHRRALAGTMDYSLLIAPYVDFKVRIQKIYPSLLKETSDKDLSLMLSAYNLYLDYYSAVVQYVGVYIWAHQTAEFPMGGYIRAEANVKESRTLLKHFRAVASTATLEKLDAILESDRSRWVEQKIDGFASTDNDLYPFQPDAAMEREFKDKGEGRSAELAGVMGALRDEIMAYTSERIATLGLRRNLTLAITFLIVGLSVGITVYAIRSITRGITDITRGIADGAAQVFAATEQIARASQSLAEGAGKQAASMEETTAMIANISEVTRDTTESARRASSMITTASSVIEESTQTISQLDRSMQEIAHNSEATKRIMSSINDIAFQTNILALNAAVEAARAGTAGAGFAVVADEVRSLAQRSAAASADTSKLIESSNANIRSGADYATRASEAFGKVEASAKGVFAQVQSIDAAAAKQVRFIEEIGQAARRVDGNTQATASSAEECAASAEELNRQARSLESMARGLNAIVYGKSQAREERRGARPAEFDRFEPRTAPATGARERSRLGDLAEKF